MGGLSTFPLWHCFPPPCHSHHAVIRFAPPHPSPMTSQPEGQPTMHKTHEPTEPFLFEAVGVRIMSQQQKAEQFTTQEVKFCILPSALKDFLTWILWMLPSMRIACQVGKEQGRGGLVRKVNTPQARCAEQQSYVTDSSRKQNNGLKHRRRDQGFSSAAEVTAWQA